LIAEAATNAGVTIPDNGGRHTFISMHVAHHESIDKTALEADNTATVIKRDYLDIVTREEAAKFWQIMPPGQPANVVAMVQAARAIRP
jgi:hypothetical protein